MNELETSLAYRPTEEDIAAVRSLPADRLPVVSVVVPSFNQADFISQTLESIFSQNYPRIEVFVSDGGSTDGTIDILEDHQKRHGDKFRYISAPDGGQHHAVNNGIRNTTGEVIAWINSDDVYCEDTFWKVVTAFHFNRCAMVFYGRNKYVDRDLNPVVDYPVDWSPVLRAQKTRMMHRCLPPQPSLFFRRVACTLSGLLTSEIVDYELWLRWQQDIPFYFMDECLSYSRLHGEAKTVRDSQMLIRGICDVVHSYYRTVPRSWTQTLAYHERYGSVWTKGGDPPPITSQVRVKGYLYWAYFNLRWAPRAIRQSLAEYRLWFRESLHGRV